jgi:hypothetical protein
VEKRLLGDASSFQAMTKKCDPGIAFEIVFQAGEREVRAYLADGCDATAVVVDKVKFSDWRDSSGIAMKLLALTTRQLLAD